jgi:hypothetical protein
MYEKPTSPQSIGQVLDGSFRLTAASFSKTWLLALLAGLAGAAASAYQFSRGGSLMEAALAPQDATYWTLYVAGVVLSILFAAAIYLRIDAVAGGTAAEGGAISVALKRLPMLIVLMILLIVAIACGLVLLIVPGLILMVSLLAAMPIFLFEDKGPVDSLTSSHRLVWGNWWRTAVILTVAFFIIMVLYFIFGFIAAAIAPLATGGDAVLGAVVSLLIVFALLGIVITPYFCALILVIYWDLKLRKEGGDLAARVQAA